MYHFDNIDIKIVNLFLEDGRVPENIIREISEKEIAATTD